MAFFGDGAVNNGAFHEGLNLAEHLEAAGAVRLREQPVRHRSAVRLRRRQSQRRRPRRGSMACPASKWTATTSWPSSRRPERRSSERAAGEGPTLLECKTYRTRAHAEGMGDFTYRTREEVEDWKTRCPIERSPPATAHGIRHAEALDAIDAEVAAVVAEAQQFAESSPLARPGHGGDARLRRSRSRRRSPRRGPAARRREITYMQATPRSSDDGDGRQPGDLRPGRGHRQARRQLQNDRGAVRPATAPSACATRRSASAASSAWRAARP